MTHFQKCSPLQSGSAILLSIKPRFANLILAGTKLAEFRRAAPSQHVSTIVIYSSAPVQSIVALVDVSETIEGTPSALWAIARDNGGGLTRSELRAYFVGKEKGYAFLLSNLRIFEKPVNPKTFFKEFTPPQSFKYLTEREQLRLEAMLERQVTK